MVFGNHRTGNDQVYHYVLTKKQEERDRKRKERNERLARFVKAMKNLRGNRKDGEINSPEA